ncbi:MAG: polyprenyl synthetase family protein [Archangiaceae bacterium]|nr:polyprenyl synthetase family protein [Archangiaceae bacterium]
MTRLAQVASADPLARFQLELEVELERWSRADDEASLDPLWSAAKASLAEFTLRPAKRVRPTLTALGWLAAQPAPQELPREVVQFAAGLELLHTFMLVHDDVADRASTRRGGPCLHHLVGEGRLGEDLAIVLGDHLYSRAMEAMFGAPSGRAVATATYVLEICRHTAAGQHLDLALARAPLNEVTLFRTLKVAELKTARYGFVAPLACGAMLAGAPSHVIDALKRAGRQAGLAYQLRDDLIGLFGDDKVAGKDGGGDYLEGKRTFPVIAAWTRADEAGRAALEALWRAPEASRLDEARQLVTRWGGQAATQRVVDSRTRAALKALEGLGAAAAPLEGLMRSLARRAA